MFGELFAIKNTEYQPLASSSETAHSNEVKNVENLPQDTMLNLLHNLSEVYNVCFEFDNCETIRSLLQSLFRLPRPATLSRQVR